MTNVLLEKKGNIAVATINRPKALNALNSQVLEDLNELVELVKADEEIRALVLTGCRLCQGDAGGHPLPPQQPDGKVPDLHRSGCAVPLQRPGVEQQ